MKLEVKNLTKKFKSLIAVKDISFTIEKNKTLGLLGPNGCGKTTSIGMMLGLITPTSGQITIDKIFLNPTNRIELLSLMNFASPYIELPKKLTVKQNLEVYARLYGVKNVKDRISEMSEDLNLISFLDKKTGELSSGQKNRVSLAKSLINKPKLLFLDEPTASLDPDVGDFVRAYLEKYKEENELTILLASHNMKEVERLCDSIVMMKKGEIVDRGTCQQLITKHGRENLEETFLKIARSKMNWDKIYALSLRHVYLIKDSFPRILDLIYWPTIQIFLWGFISKFFTLTSSFYENTVGIILSAAILYDFLFRSSISYNMMFLEEIWSRNFQIYL